MFIRKLFTLTSIYMLKILEYEEIEAIQVDFPESHKFAIAGLHFVTLELIRDQRGLY
jgi:hypothetical protein